MRFVENLVAVRLSENGRLGAVVVAAVCLHVIGVIVMPRAHLKPTSEIEPQAIDVVFEEQTNNTSSTTSAPGAVAHAAHAGHLGRPSVEGSMTVGPVGSTGQPTTDVPGENGREPFHMFSAPNGSEGWTQDIGLQGPGSYRVAEALRAPTEQEMANERARRLLSAPDVALATGPVTQELERVANHGLVPNEGYAVFTAYIDDSGLVVSLKVTNMSSSADVRDWDEVARTTLSILEKRKLPMPRGARGVEVSIRVISAVKMPSGSRAPITGQLFGKPDPSSPTVPILSGSFDLSDIGAHPIHTIAAHVESQKIF